VRGSGGWWGAVAAGGRGQDEPLAAGVTVQPPAAFVDGTVVDPAQQHQVVQAGRTTLNPVSQVVGVGPGRRPVTAGRDAAAVAYRQGASQRGRDKAGGAAEVKELGGGAKRWGSRVIARCSRPASPPPSWLAWPRPQRPALPARQAAPPAPRTAPPGLRPPHPGWRRIGWRTGVRIHGATLPRQAGTTQTHHEICGQPARAGNGRRPRHITPDGTARRAYGPSALEVGGSWATTACACVAQLGCFRRGRQVVCPGWRLRLNAASL
jgi:hypothetical protein